MFYVVRDEKGCDRGSSDDLLAARRSLEDHFMCERNHNFYLLSIDGDVVKELGRRINANRYGGPRAR